MKTVLKTAGGSVKAYIIEEGDRKSILTPNGEVLGWYLKSQDKTFNRSGTMIGFGEQLQVLLK